MTPADLRQWQARMGYTQQAAADALGVGVSAYKDWAAGRSRTTGKPISIDRRTALACAALGAGLEPLGTTGITVEVSARPESA